MSRIMIPEDFHLQDDDKVFLSIAAGGSLIIVIAAVVTYMLAV